MLGVYMSSKQKSLPWKLVLLGDLFTEKTKLIRNWFQCRARKLRRPRACVGKMPSWGIPDTKRGSHR